MKLSLSSSIDGPGALVMMIQDQSSACRHVAHCRAKWYCDVAAKWKTKSRCHQGVPLEQCYVQQDTVTQLQRAGGLTYERLNF